MDYAQIVKLAKDMGLNDSRARVAAAIAMAESGGDPGQVTNDSDDLSYGLWQINMIGTLGPDRRKKYGLPNNNALLDPRRNAMVMADISQQGGNFSAWTTYTDQKYKKFLKGQSVLDTLSPSNVADGISGTVGNVTDNVGDIAHSAGVLIDGVSKFSAWISDGKNWVRIGYVAGGATIAIVAISQLLKGTTVGDAVKKASDKAVGAATTVASRGTVKGKS